MTNVTQINDPGVYHRSIQGGKWFMLDVVGQKFINLVTFFILARILLPEDYGVMAIVLMVTGLLNQLTNLMFGEAMLQRKGSAEDYLDTIWTFDVLRSAVMAIVVFFGGGLIAEFFNMTGNYVWLMRLGGLLVFLPAFSNTRQFYFFKNLDFKTVLYRDLLAQLALSIGTICFALFFSASAWALFVGYLIQAFVGIALSYIFYPSWPRLSFQFRKLRDLAGYTKWIYAQNFLALLFSQIDKLTIGRLMSPQSLGIYAKSKDLSSMATTMTASMIRKVGLPAFSKIQDKLDKVQEGFIKSVDLAILFSLPITLLLLFEGGAVVSILLGSKWLAIVVPMKIFAFGNLFMAFIGIVNPVLGALGRPDINFKTSVFQAVLTIPFIFLGMRYYGINGLAWGVVLAWFFVLLYIIYTTRPILKISKRAFIPSLACAVIASGLVFLFDLVLRSLAYLSINENYTGLGRSVLLGVAYFVVLYIVGKKFKQGPWFTLLSILKELHLWPAEKAL